MIVDEIAPRIVIAVRAIAAMSIAPRFAAAMSRIRAAPPPFAAWSPRMSDGDRDTTSFCYE